MWLPLFLGLTSKTIHRKTAVRQFRLPGTSFVELQAPGVAVSPRDRESALREQRGLGLYAMGLVSRVGDGYIVSGSVARTASVNAEVRRDAQDRLRCNCREFRARGLADRGFQCEHIIAVKHFEQTRARNTETALSPRLPYRQQSPSPAPPTVRDHSESRTGDERALRFDGDPCARSFAELVSPRQLAMIRQLARDTAVDAERECMKLVGCATGDLSKAAASFYIEHLMAAPRHTGEAEMRLAS
jgi:hypothetical protein